MQDVKFLVYNAGVSEHKPIIFAEMLRKWSAKTKYPPNDIIALLKPLYYQRVTDKDNKLTEFFLWTRT